MITNTKNNNWKTYREWEKFKVFNPEWGTFNTLLPTSFGIYVKEDRKIISRAGGWFYKKNFSRHNRVDVHMNSLRLWQCIQELHMFKPDKMQHKGKGMGIMFQPEPKTIGNNSYWKRENHFFNELTMDNISSVEQTPCFRIVGQHE